MQLPSIEECSKDPLLNMIRQGDAREYFSPRRGANQRFLVERRMDYSLELLLKHLSIDKTAPVADFACGSGTFGLLLAEQGYNVDFIDNEPNFFDYIKMKKTKGNINFIEADTSTFISEKNIIQFELFEIRL